MSLYLNVPFAEKDEAKALGAWWDPAKKQWFVKNKKDYPKFQKWILSADEEECMVLCDHFYIVEGVQTCFKCKKPTKVMGFGIENFFTFYQEGVEPEYCEGEIHISSSLEPLSKALLEYLKKTYNYYYGYSKFTNSNYYGHHCDNCGILQGNFYLFSEVDSPFFIDGPEAAKALRLFRVALPYDIKAYAELGFGSEDYLIKQHAEMAELEVTP